MVKRTPIPVIPEEKEVSIPEEKIYNEQQVLQAEAIARMPPLASLLLEKQYDLSYTIKIAIGVGTLLALYFLVGLDAVITGMISFAIFMAFGYLVQSRNIDKDKTIFFETRKAGQIIDPKVAGTPQYPHKFQVSFDRTAIFAVPNTHLRKGLFKMPGEPVNPLPGSGNWVFVDLFDERNGTCVLPRTTDTANVCLDTNMNRTLATHFDYQLTRNSQLDAEERMTLDRWEMKQLSAGDAERRLLYIRRQRNALFGPGGQEAKRDVFFALQQQIPMLQDMLRVTRNSIITLANSMVAEIAYEMIHQPIPSGIRKNINMVRKKLNAPLVGQFDIDDLLGL